MLQRLFVRAFISSLIESVSWRLSELMGFRRHYPNLIGVEIGVLLFVTGGRIVNSAMGSILALSNYADGPI